MLRLSLKGRILGLIILVIAVSLISLGYTMMKMQDIGELTQKLYRHPFTVTTNVLEAGIDIVAIHRDMKDVVLATSEEQLAAAITDMNDRQEEVLKDFKMIEERILGDEGKALHDKAKKLFLAWEPIRNEAIRLMQEDRRSEAAEITREKGHDHLQGLLASMDAMTHYAYNKANEFKDTSAQELRETTTTAIVLSIAVILFSLGLGFVFAKNLTNPIMYAVQELSTTASQILAAIQQQTSSMKEQAVAVQETTTTMEEVGQTGYQISNKAKEIAQSAEATSSAGASGIQAVQEANQTMDLIREQVEQVAENIVSLSEKTQVIGDIILTVNDIAEQSNLLSLNASIEAVGAGEHGKRFSVVANEIKNLADEAKASTVEIRTILTEIQKEINTSVMSTEESVKRVELGKTKSDIASVTIQSLTQTTEESIQAFQQIVASTNQQQIGLEQVAEALKNIHIATEQTSSGVDQVEKAVQNLNDLGIRLRTLVEKS